MLRRRSLASRRLASSRLGGGLATSLLRSALARHLRALLACFAEPDRDRLVAALHRSATPAALQRPALALVHRALDALARGLAVLAPSGLLGSHRSLSAYGWLVAQRRAPARAWASLGATFVPARR